MNNHKYFYVKIDLRESGATLSVGRSRLTLSEIFILVMSLLTENTPALNISILLVQI